MLPYVCCCSHGLLGTGRPSVFLLIAGLAVETTSPGWAVPEASTTSLVFPADGGLNGAAPEEADPALSHGFGGGLLPAPEYRDIHYCPVVTMYEDYSFILTLLKILYS